MQSLQVKDRGLNRSNARLLVSSLAVKQVKSIQDELCKGVISIGMKTSESPDAVQSLKGRAPRRAYGTPQIACHYTSQTLNMPSVAAQWSVWMEDDAAVSDEDVPAEESGSISSGNAASIRIVERRTVFSHPRPPGMERIERSSFVPDRQWGDLKKRHHEHGR